MVYALPTEVWGENAARGGSRLERRALWFVPETNDFFKIAVSSGNTGSDLMRTASNRKAEARRTFRQGYPAQISGDYDVAVELYIKSVALCPTAEVHVLLGSAFRVLGKMEDAIAECKRAIEIDPECGDAFNDVGTYLLDCRTLRRCNSFGTPDADTNIRRSP